MVVRGEQQIIHIQSVGAINAFATIALLPDPDAITAQQTRTKTGTSDPIFNEVFHLYEFC